MTTVLMGVGKNDRDFWHGLVRLLEKQFSMLELREGAVIVPDRPPQLLLCPMSALGEIRSRKVIALYKEPQAGELRLEGAQQVVAVVDSSNPNLAEQVSGTGFPAVTCGMSGKDTVTLSSIGADSAVINIQRSIQCFDGAVAEPQEIPLSLSRPRDGFLLMAAAAVFIATGNLPQLSKGKL